MNFIKVSDGSILNLDQALAVVPINMKFRTEEDERHNYEYEVIFTGWTKKITHADRTAIGNSVIK
jgi:hypothetical protein